VCGKDQIVNLNGLPTPSIPKNLKVSKKYKISNPYLEMYKRCEKSHARKFWDTIPENSETQFRKISRHKSGDRMKQSVKHHADSDKNSENRFRFRKIPLPMNSIEKFRNRFPEYRKIPKPISSLILTVEAQLTIWPNRCWSRPAAAAHVTHRY
jgi:hypothetical protein